VGSKNFTPEKEKRKKLHLNSGSFFFSFPNSVVRGKQKCGEGLALKVQPQPCSQRPLPFN
jgi:hypothetical protein